jgi:hypothetical protein
MPASDVSGSKLFSLREVAEEFTCKLDASISFRNFKRSGLQDNYNSLAETGW